MKKIVLLSLIALFSFQAQAQIKSSLTIFSRDGEKFWIVRNGIKQNDVPTTSVTMEGITDRSFKIKVLIDDDKLTTVDQNIYTIDVDEKVCDLTYELRKNSKKKYSLRLISFVPTKLSTQPEKPVVVEMVAPEVQTPSPQVTTPNVQVNMSGSGFMANGSMCDAPTMNPKAYLDFRYEIEAQNMYRREEYIKNMFSKNCMLAEQIAGIINLKYATVDELSIAKHGYRYTFDTENYGVVLDAIKSETKKRDLLTFLNVSQGSVQTTTNTTTNSENLNIQINDPNLGVNFNVNVPNTNVSSTTTTTTHQTTAQSPDRPYRKGDRPRAEPVYDNNCRGAMPTADFNQATAQIKKTSFADSKMKIAQQITRSNCLSVNQIIEICKLFSFEDNKLEFAKFAYDFTFEKNKYYLVNEVFSFSSSRDELDSFILNK
ncbi:MAG: DUF4476 domain-containing protein [Bacteroidales bacterium]|nr:DUF4476 domain-containing protein [Bacteroidales bacterium]MDY0216174.1 DUF4476 domain-containing protein [Bacteroidales bacterium]